MKNSILITIIILLFVHNVNAQSSDDNPSTWVTNNPASFMDPNGDHPEVWPWSGCKDFTVTVTVAFLELETVITICCNQGVCWPANNNRIPEGSNQVQVSSSSSNVIGNYIIQIEDGTYNVDKNGKIIGLKYRIRSN